MDKEIDSDVHISLACSGFIGWNLGWRESHGYGCVISKPKIHLVHLFAENIKAKWFCDDTGNAT